MIYLNCIEEIIMPPLLFRIERKARLLLGALAFLTLVALLLFRTQLIQFQPSFDAYGWYTVHTVNSAITITDRADDEASCRAKSRLPDISCLQGKSLNQEFFALSRVH
jgi:hypothetical protein